MASIMNIEKENRKKYLSPEPLQIHAQDEKSFDNLVDFEKFIVKHITELGTSSVSFFERDEDDDEEYRLKLLSENEQVNKEILEYIKKFACDIIDLNIRVCWKHKRLENEKEIENRFKWINYYNGLDTRQLLAMRHTHEYTEKDECDHNVLLAVLDTKEHVPSGAERKKIRQEKAKEQKNR